MFPDIGELKKMMSAQHETLEELIVVLSQTNKLLSKLDETIIRLETKIDKIIKQ